MHHNKLLHCFDNNVEPCLHMIFIVILIGVRYTDMKTAVTGIVVDKSIPVLSELTNQQRCPVLNISEYATNVIQR